LKETSLDIEIYDFNEHIDSIEWIYNLPNGLLSEKIDIRYNAVTITKLDDGYQIYVGPKDPDLGGDGLMVNLDDNFQLISYEIERIEPMPF
jgi:hypothetical protein